ncbi:MAG: hypothetical protein Fur0023_11860 [Bacteroidia bacterium]
MVDLLNISMDSAYRRIRCETEITMDEMFRLCEYFKVSADSLLFTDVNTATFIYKPIFQSISNFEEHLKKIEQNMESIISMPDIHMYYAAEEVPLFHSLYSEHLIRFKLFYWMRNILGINEFNHQYNPDIIPNNLVKTSLKINRLYKDIPSSEIWSNETVLTFIKQIEFSIEAGLFSNKEIIMNLIEEHNKMLETLKINTENGHKENRKNIVFNLYKSDIMIGTNSICVEKNNIPILSYVSFNTLNTLSTSNQTFSNEVSKWIKNLIKKSTLLSGTSEKERYKFFNEMFKKTAILKEKVKDLVIY